MYFWWHFSMKYYVFICMYILFYSSAVGYSTDGQRELAITVAPAFGNTLHKLPLSRPYVHCYNYSKDET